MASLRPTASTVIDAPIDLVWQVMVDTAAYAEWNPFVERVEIDGPPAVGSPVVLHVRWANGRTNASRERITVLDGPRDDGGTARAELTYVFEGLPHRLGLVHSTRAQRLSQVGDGPTHYESVMDLTGPLARLAGPSRITEGFERHAAGLRQRAEALARR